MRAATAHVTFGAVYGVVGLLLVVVMMYSLLLVSLADPSLSRLALLSFGAVYIMAYANWAYFWLPAVGADSSVAVRKKYAAVLLSHATLLGVISFVIVMQIT